MSWQSHLDTIDEASASLIVRLQQDDMAESLEIGSPQHQADAVVRDSMFAMELYRSELEHFQAIHSNTSIFDVIVANIARATIPYDNKDSPLEPVRDQCVCFLSLNFVVPTNSS